MKTLLAIALSLLPLPAYAYPPEYGSLMLLDQTYPPVRSQGWTLFQYTIPRYNLKFRGLTHYCWHGQVKDHPQSVSRENLKLSAPGWYRVDNDAVEVYADLIHAQLLLRQVCAIAD